MRIDSGTHANIELRTISRRPASQQSRPTRKHAQSISAGSRGLAKGGSNFRDEGYGRIHRLLTGHTGHVIGPMPAPRHGRKSWLGRFGNLFGGAEKADAKDGTKGQTPPTNGLRA